MRSKSYDVVVVGAGMAGLVAAAAAIKLRQRVALVTTGPGSFVLSAGWLRDFHAKPEDVPEELREAVSFFTQTASLAGCSYAGSLSAVEYLPTLLGDLQRVSMAPFYLWIASPRSGRSTAIVGIKGLTSFDAGFMAEQLNANTQALGIKAAYRPWEIALPRNFGVPATTVQIASCFDRDPGFRSELLEALRPVAQRYEHILLPGILGLQTEEEQIAQFSAQLGCTVSELCTLPPSVPSLRLYSLLKKQLGQMGVDFYKGFPVESLEVRDRRCETVCVASPGRLLRLEGESVVMAAGRGARRLLAGCAETNEVLHPLDNGGAVWAQNLYVAGTLSLDGPARRGDVDEILLGYRAGNLAALNRGSNAL